MDFLTPEIRAAHYSRVNSRLLEIILRKLVAYYNTSAGGNVSSRRRINTVSLPFSRWRGRVADKLSMHRRSCFGSSHVGRQSEWGVELVPM